MRSGEGEWAVSEHGAPGAWKTGVPPGTAWKKRGAWGTAFSGFRFAIPEVCGFAGRAVYFDIDMLVLGDVRELLEFPLTHGYHSISLQRTDVSVIDCGFFKDKSWWPALSVMKPSGWITWHLCQILAKNNAVMPNLPREWNDCDGMLYAKTPGVVKLVHYTTVTDGQPYCPYPGVRYSVPWPHARNRVAAELWWRTYWEATQQNVSALRQAVAEAHRRTTGQLPDAGYVRQVLLRTGVPAEAAEAAS